MGMSRGWVCPGDGYVHGVALSGGGYVKRVGTHPPPPDTWILGYGRQAGDAHPTGMLSY